MEYQREDPNGMSCHRRPRGRGPAAASSTIRRPPRTTTILDHVVEAPLKRVQYRRGRGANPPILDHVVEAPLKLLVGIAPVHLDRAPSSTTWSSPGLAPVEARSDAEGPHRLGKVVVGERFQPGHGRKERICRCSSPDRRNERSPGRVAPRAHVSRGIPSLPTPTDRGEHVHADCLSDAETNAAPEFVKLLEKEIVPKLRDEPGFQDELLFISAGGPDLVSISIWDSREAGPSEFLKASPITTPVPGVGGEEHARSAVRLPRRRDSALSRGAARAGPAAASLRSRYDADPGLYRSRRHAVGPDLQLFGVLEGLFRVPGQRRRWHGAGRDRAYSPGNTPVPPGRESPRLRRQQDQQLHLGRQAHRAGITRCSGTPRADSASRGVR